MNPQERAVIEAARNLRKALDASLDPMTKMPLPPTPQMQMNVMRYTILVSAMSMALDEHYAAQAKAAVGDALDDIPDGPMY